MSDVDADAWRTAVIAAGGVVNGPQQYANETFIGGLKTDGVWSKLLRLFPIFATSGVTSAGAYIDFVARAAATTVGSPTWTARSGITTTSTAYLNLSTPGASPYVQDSASIGFDKIDTNDPTTLIEMGTTNTSGAVISYASIRATDTGCYVDLNAVGATFDTTQATPANGVWILTRNAASGAGSSVFYRDAVSAASGSNPTSTGVPNQNFVLGGYLDSTGTFSNGGGASSQIFGMALIGGALTATDVTNIGLRWATYKTTVSTDDVLMAQAIM